MLKFRSLCTNSYSILLIEIIYIRVSPSDVWDHVKIFLVMAGFCFNESVNPKKIL